MFQILKTLSDTLSGKASIFIILTAIVTFFYPDLFAWVKGNTQTIILGIIMLTMGLTLTPNDFRLLAKRPLDIFIGAVAQFTIMPLVAFTLSWLFSQVPAFAPYSTAMAIGIILVGCCPGGVSSNIMSFLCKGDVAYSVGMTCASTLLAPVLTPLLVLWLAGAKVDVDAIGMFKQILIVTIIPIAIGFGMNVWLGHKEYRFWSECVVRTQGGVPKDSRVHAWTFRALPRLHRRWRGDNGSRPTCGERFVTLHPHFCHGLLPQYHRLYSWLFGRQTLPFLHSQEAHHLHRGGYAERRTWHQSRHDFLRCFQPNGCGTLRHQLCLALHQRHHHCQHLCCKR